ncbi:methionyl-tRNA formyltransferase [soil metagenome]
MPPSIRLVLLGTKDFALPTFEALFKLGRVAALITQPDRPQGRKQLLIPSRVKQAAIALGVPVHQPEEINSPEGVELVRSLNPDLLVTVAYGQILSAEVLSIPPLGGINLHGSILPKYRGAAPVARAIQAGETETGVTVILMTPKVDAGGMIALARTAIDPDETAGELEARLARLGPSMVLDAIERLEAGTVEILPQDQAHVTKAPKLRKEDGILDWSWSARAVHNLIRAMNPWPLASTHWHPAEASKDPLRLIVHQSRVVEGQGAPGQVLVAEGNRLEVAAGHESVRLLTMQVPGKKAMPADAYLRGHRVQVGDRFGESP